MDSVLLGIDAPVQNRPRFLESQEPTKPNADHIFSKLGKCVITYAFQDQNNFCSIVDADSSMQSAVYN